MESWKGGFITAATGGGGKLSSESEDFEEGEVWETVREGSKTRNSKNLRGSSSSAWRLKATKTRSVPGAAADGGGREDSAASHSVKRRQSLSVPVDHILDWSKSSRKRSEKKVWEYDACDGDDHRGKVDEIDDEDDDDDDDEMVPPHEYLSRRLANSQIASHSMCEGVGRTLKGRDLSKLRNAILTKTGFIE